MSWKNSNDFGSHDGSIVKNFTDWSELYSIYAALLMSHPFWRTVNDKKLVKVSWISFLKRVSTADLSDFLCYSKGTLVPWGKLPRWINVNESDNKLFPPSSHAICVIFLSENKIVYFNISLKFVPMGSLGFRWDFKWFTSYVKWWTKHSKWI